MVDQDLFKAGMRLLGGAVNVVTTADGDERFGLTATAVCSLSAEPPMILTCVNRAGITFDAIKRSGVVCINTLSSEHKELAMHFAGMMGEAENNRFSEGDWSVGTVGGPVLKDALVSFDCKVSEISEQGTHGIIIGEIQDIHLGSVGSPLFYLDGKFVTSQDI